MRTTGLLVLLLCTNMLLAQRSLVINELQASNRRTIVDAQGGTPDWVEVYNVGAFPVDMRGMRFAVAGRQHHIDEELIVPARQRRMLWFDGHPERGVDHIGFTLPRMGGTLLLVASDGATIVDVFTYPAMVGDLSVGRCVDGLKEWSFFTTATPDEANFCRYTIRSRARTPSLDSTAIRSKRIELDGDIRTDIRYTLDGTEPTIGHGELYFKPLELGPNVVVRAKAFAAEQLPSKELCFTLIDGVRPASGITLALDPVGLMDDSTGINVEGALANFSRRGRSWERLAMVQFNHTSVPPLPVGLSIHGSGSRSLAKRSFKLHARDRYDSPANGFDLGGAQYFNEGILRADAGPYNFLRNLFMETLVRENGLQVDVQPSQPLPLYLNGHYWGLYRWMPPKDAQWLKRISGASAVEVLDGPAAVALNGNDLHFKQAQYRLLTAWPIDSITAMIDTRSLIDLACLDLWTGRADHELNVRCYRPRERGGRWRWILFDMDLWAPANENSIQRMGLSATKDTPYVPELLQHPVLHEQFLARFSALLATALDPTHATALADSLYRTHADALNADHLRWKNELQRPDPAASDRELKEFIAARPEHIMSHLSRHTRHKLRSVTVIAPPAERGTLRVEGFVVTPGRHEFKLFSDIRMQLKAQPAEGWSLAGWKNEETLYNDLHLDPTQMRLVQPLFVKDVP